MKQEQNWLLFLSRVQHVGKHRKKNQMLKMFFVGNRNGILRLFNH